MMGIRVVNSNIGIVGDVAEEHPVKSLAALLVQPVGDVAGDLLLKLLDNGREVCHRAR